MLTTSSSGCSCATSMQSTKRALGRKHAASVKSQDLGLETRNMQQHQVTIWRHNHTEVCIDVRLMDTKLAKLRFLLSIACALWLQPDGLHIIAQLTTAEPQSTALLGCLTQTHVFPPGRVASHRTPPSRLVYTMQPYSKWGHARALPLPVVKGHRRACSSPRRSLIPLLQGRRHGGECLGRSREHAVQLDACPGRMMQRKHPAAHRFALLFTSTITVVSVRPSVVNLVI
ncbi:hypothetical protein IE81DRAFT_97960 [Ceraceosorus guamensis]|uniref:Uncharacterized protein n=1 Tax=Ceraceosorus guamensis TaxID=1522189 RepID=A0A316W046_9BASI|nr:hypothetical protein IE81DRAFT_97960 [Ceraceosorus guamensis]PWN43150.1 hypothetical protein IE81DRAFT_97960 [Ceraceosorus guamensis]